MQISGPIHPEFTFLGLGKAQEPAFNKVLVDDNEAGRGATLRNQ